MNSFNIYILHYTPLVERKKHIINQIKKYNYKAKYIETFNREDLTIENLNLFNTNKVKSSSISLIYKHIESWQQISNDNAHSFSLILEDDVILIDNFDEKLNEYIQQLPSNFDMLFIGDGCNLHIPDSIIKHTINENGGKIVNIFKKTNYPTNWGGNGATRCTDSYLISKNCCNKILEYIKGIKNKIELPIDWWMNTICRDLDLNVYWAEPTICSQGTESGVFTPSCVS